MQCYLAPIYWCLFQESYLTEHPLQMDSLPASDKDGLIAFWHKKTIFFWGEEALCLPLSYCTSLSILAEVILDLMFPTMWEYNTLKVAINIFVLISGVPSSLSCVALTLPYNIQNAKKILRFCVMKIFQNWCENLFGQLVCLGLTVSARLQVSSMRTLLRNVGLTFWSAIVFPLSRPATDTRVEHLTGNIKTDQIRNKQIIKSFS